MNIIEQAQKKREALQRELGRIEAFLATAYELQQEFGASGKPSVKAASDGEKADAPVRERRSSPAGSGSATLNAVVEILRERDTPMSTRDLLPLVLAKGIEVGGKDANATLSARISQKGVIAVNGGKWWFIENGASGAEASGEEAADIPTKEQSAASLFHSDQGEHQDAAALAS